MEERTLHRLLSHAFQAGVFTDVVVKAGFRSTIIIKAHRLVLSVRSELMSNFLAEQNVGVVHGEYQLILPQDLKVPDEAIRPFFEVRACTLQLF
jgi:hypothetical protein